MIQTKIPIIIRLPLHLLSISVIAFGPIYALSFFVKSFFVLGIILILWGEFIRRFILWRFDCFWNLKTLQNKTALPLKPDNLKRFTTWKGYMYWIFLGWDIEKQKL